MRVMFVYPGSGKYGAGKSLLSLIDGLLQKEVQCCVIMSKEGSMVEELKNRGIKYAIVPFKSWVFEHSSLCKRLLRTGFNLLISLVIAVKAQAWKVDIIYTNNSVPCVGALAAFLLRKPHIWHIREFGQEDYRFSFDLGKRLSMKLIDWLSFRVIVISEALKQKYVQYISPEKIQRIYNPVHLQEEAAGVLDVDQRIPELESNIPSLAIVGLIHPGKRQLDAILAIGELIRQGVQVKLIIVGDGDLGYLKQLKQAVAQNGIEEYVKFTGYVDNPAPITESSDVVLVCSQWEAFGRVTVEGMLAGKPVIGAHSGATVELVKEGFNGLLYKPGNHRDLAKKIKYLINHPEEAEQMGINGFKWASKEFTIEKCASKVFGILQETMQAKSSKRDRS